MNQNFDRLNLLLPSFRGYFEYNHLNMIFQAFLNAKGEQKSEIGNQLINMVKSLPIGTAEERDKVQEISDIVEAEISEKIKEEVPPSPQKPEKVEDQEKVETFSHTVTEEDLKNNPELKEEGIKEGDEIEIPKTEEDDKKLQEKFEQEKSTEIEKEPSDKDIKNTEEKINDPSILDQLKEANKANEEAQPKAPRKRRGSNPAPEAPQG